MNAIPLSDSDPADQNDRFPIRVLSERTGVSTSTLRAWERRYNLLKPERTPKGHRLYSASDEALVKRVLVLLEGGHSLSAIAGQISRDVGMLLKAEDRMAQTGVWREFVTVTLQAVADFSHERIEKVYNEASSLYPLDMVLDLLIEPVLARLGDRWRENPVGIAEEHFYSSWVRNRLAARFHHGYSQSKGARIVCACVPNAYHEIGLLLFSLSALTRGYRVLYFGANLPLEQIQPVMERSGARAVVLSSREPLSDELESQLCDLAQQCKVPVMLGGYSADQPLKNFEQSGGIRLGSRISVAMQLLTARIPVHRGAARD